MVLPVDGRVILVVSNVVVVPRSDAGVGVVAPTPVPTGDGLVSAVVGPDGTVVAGDVVAGVVVAGVVVGGTVAVTGVQLGAVKVSLSRVTAPLRARARPWTTTALWTVIDVRAKMLPTNTEPVPSVAELPTCQNTLHSVAPLISSIELPELVINVESVWKMKTALGLFWPSRTSWPLRPSGALADA